MRVGVVEVWEGRHMRGDADGVKISDWHACV